MKKSLNLVLAGIMYFLPDSAKARVVEKCITHIHEVLENTMGLPEDGSTIVVLDWDRTISRSEGGYDFREFGENGTEETIKALQIKNYKTMVLTARLAGFGFSEECRGDLTAHEIGNEAESVINKMLTKFPQWDQAGPLLDEKLESIKNPDLDVCLLKGKQIVFAGGISWKGDAVKLLIEGRKFVTKPKNIIFVDNGPFQL